MPDKSARSVGLPVATWSKKLGEYVKGDKRDANLTKENLHEFNKRNALIEARYNASSPYHKGLTDFLLDINREKLSGFNPVRERNAAKFISPCYKTEIFIVINMEKYSESSPGRESQSASSISSGSKSSFAVKEREPRFGLCLGKLLDQTKCRQKKNASNLLEGRSSGEHPRKLNVLHNHLENSRAIILHEVDRLSSTDSLSYVKWMPEKFKGCSKVLFCCIDASKLESIKPLFRFIQLPKPTNEEMQSLCLILSNCQFTFPKI
ncbi:hypothetical protein AAHA92_24443 [Salvia divinorum]|uniref:Uncharacterized protein n=1 Tax=Salvia divinorum TaxID=28513 RepID=A0ABD1G7E4_SALDI